MTTKTTVFVKVLNNSVEWWNASCMAAVLQLCWLTQYSRGFHISKKHISTVNSGGITATLCQDDPRDPFRLCHFGEKKPQTVMTVKNKVNLTKLNPFSKSGKVHKRGGGDIMVETVTWAPVHEPLGKLGFLDRREWTKRLLAETSFLFLVD